MAGDNASEAEGKFPRFDVRVRIKRSTEDFHHRRHRTNPMMRESALKVGTNKFTALVKMQSIGRG
jgi:hypothetical protein